MIIEGCQFEFERHGTGRKLVAYLVNLPLQGVSATFRTPAELEAYGAFITAQVARWRAEQTTPVTTT